MATVTRVSSTSRYGICDMCPGLVIRWKNRAAHLDSQVTHLLDAVILTPDPTPSPTPVPDVGTIKPVSYWRGLFDGNESSTWNENLALSKSGDEWKIYNLGYGIDGYLAMYEATGATSYLDKCIALVKNVVATARVSSSISGSQFRDSYLGWGQYSHPQTGTAVSSGGEYPLFESYGWRYVTRLLMVLSALPAYSATYADLLAFTERNIFDKWYNRSVNSNIYRQNTHMASHWAMISMHLALLTKDATRKVRCETVRDNFDRLGLPNYSRASMRSQLKTLADGGYSWSAEWAGTAPQDVAHGNAVVAYVAEAIRLGSYWTPGDGVKFAKTMQRVQPKDFSVDGTGVGNGWFADGFVKVGRFGEDFQRSLESHAVNTQGQFRANMALNAKYLT